MRTRFDGVNDYDENESFDYNDYPYYPQSWRRAPEVGVCNGKSKYNAIQMFEPQTKTVGNEQGDY